MRVLIACEFSGVVRRAFRDRGHDAWSCDLLPAEDDSEFHLPHDVRDILGAGLGYSNPYAWDMLIAHPPCTYLANSGVKWLYKGGKYENGRDEERWANMQQAARFFRIMLDTPISRIAVENPIMHGYGLELIEQRHDQVIQPWMFGHGETKATCLWLKNLPALTPTKIVEGRTPRVHHASPGPDRWKERSRTLEGIASAMADQWGSLGVQEQAA